MRISDWSSDVCSSDLDHRDREAERDEHDHQGHRPGRQVQRGQHHRGDLDDDPARHGVQQEYADHAPALEVREEAVPGLRLRSASHVEPPCGKGHGPSSARSAKDTPPAGRWGLRGIQGFPATPRLGVDSPDIQNLHRGTRMNHRFLLSAALLAFIGTAAEQQQAPPTQQATQQQATQQQARPAQQQLTPQQQAQLAKQNSDMSKAALQVMQMVDANQIGQIWDNASATMKRLVTRDDFVKRSEEHTSELQSLMRISYTVFCLK